MKISNVNYSVQERTPKYVNNKQSFKSVGMLDKGALFVADAIENGGLAVSFTLQDMLGTNLPRPLMGLKRNAQENEGQVNKKFAAKEFVREMTTGPSMFVIPAVILAGVKKFFGKASDVPASVIKALGDIHVANAVDSAGKAIGKEEFYKSAFANIIKNAKSEVEVSESTLNSAAELAKKLIEIPKGKRESKAVLNGIAEKLVNISKTHAKDAAYTEFTSAALSENVHVGVKDAISYITAYADDLVEKAKGQDTSKLLDFIKKATNKKVIGRFALNIAMYSAIMAFLQIIPKLYNKAEGKDNAGLKGLMKEETLKSQPAQQNANSADVQKDKTRPSFGSSAEVAKAITSNGILGKFAKAIEFSGCNLSFPLLVGVMTFGIIGPRVKNSKDKYDREEILRRDVVTCTVMCVGEKELRKGFSKLNENKSGFVLAVKDKGFKDKSIIKRVFDYIRPIKGVQVMSTDQIVSRYSNIGAYKDKLSGFCEFVDSHGGNLAKVLGLTDESKSLIESLLQQEGKTLATADNNTIKEVVSKAKDSEEVKKLIDLFKSDKNPWVQKAKTLNARFTALSILVLVPVFLGFLLPWINEKTTKKKFAEDNNINNKIQNQNTLPMMNYNNSDLFKDITEKFITK